LEILRRRTETEDLVQDVLLDLEREGRAMTRRPPNSHKATEKKERRKGRATPRRPPNSQKASLTGKKERKESKKRLRRPRKQ